MPKKPRFFPSGYIFHVMNRTAVRSEIFSKQQDYDAFIVAALLKEQIQPEYRSFDLDIIGWNIEDSDIISCTHDDFIFIYRNETDNIPITNNTQ